MFKNVTLSAKTELIQRAQEKAKFEHSTLNAQFCHWLERYVYQAQRVENYTALMVALSYAQAGDCFNRDELNER